MTMTIIRPGGQEEIAQGRGRCPQCSVLVSFHSIPILALLIQ